ncbi:hypothetical protein [Alkalilimnicola sp. S0819]|uniref:hypothetical protein n=1 Tax=Alkalilimnicola sp. S0819 TaxID=2613922 RepID=UPI001261DB6B|nr:hypothetical protein [Alkalilimnicola sp. S0819]KAB7627749.1 hypothetical protein F3N43_01860 [Alkalilimnicola sp. S0819]MPQ15372.1 hypothetical protein [Alkalilimnicola sp. S0819]
MTVVKLNAVPEDGSPSEQLTLVFEDDESALLRQFIRNCDRLRGARILSDFPTIKNIRWKAESGLSLEISDFAYGDVCALLHLARPIFLAREPASFEKTCALFGRKGRGTSLARHIKTIRQVYEHGDYQPYFQISVNGVPLFDDSSLKSWLNGVEYHQDEDKAELVGQLERALSQEAVRGVFVSQLSGRIRATLMLEHLAHLILEPVEEQ